VKIFFCIDFLQLTAYSLRYPALSAAAEGWRYRAPGQVLIGTRASLLSAGTKRRLVECGHANLLEKARSQPERVRQVLDKVRTDGLLPTLEAVRDKLDQPLSLGYCNTGMRIRHDA
jgi:hypothetical protein